jgi:hypothetical protein
MPVFRNIPSTRSTAENEMLGGEGRTVPASVAPHNVRRIEVRMAGHFYDYVHAKTPASTSIRPAIT